METQILDILKNIQSDISSMKSEMSSIKSEMSSMKSEMSSMKSEMSSMKSEMSSMKSQLDENTQILKALEHNAEVNKSEHDKIFNELAHIKGDIKEIKKDLLKVEVATANNWSDIATLKSVKLSQN